MRFGSRKNYSSYNVEKDAVTGKVVRHTRSSGSSLNQSYSKGRLTLNFTKSKYNQYGDLKGQKDFSFSFNLLNVVLIILLAASIVTVLGAQGGEPKTFYGFLQTLQEVPDLSWDWIKLAQMNIAFPDWLSWLNPVIDFLSSLYLVAGFLINGIVQALAFIVWILGYILG